jgi:hypothetical protein
VADCRRATVREDGDAESEKSALGLDTTRDTVVVCTRAPLVPVIVSVLEPVGVVALVVTVIVDDPEPVTEAGLKLAVASAGNPLALRVTVPLKPPNAVTLTV